MSRFEIYLSKNDLEHIANGYSSLTVIAGMRLYANCIIHGGQSKKRENLELKI